MPRWDASTLFELLRERGIGRVVVVGLATDVCVAATARSAAADGFDTTIYYRDVTRGYLPTPGNVAADIQAQLKDNLNINAEVVVMESGEFIQASEEMGIAVQIDRLVADEACKQVRPWQVQFRMDPPITISLNISTTQFLQLELVSRIDHTLRQNGLYGRDIKLEVTESVLMDDVDRSTECLGALKDMGVVGAGGLALAAIFSNSLEVFLVGLGIAFFAFMLPQPLITQIYQNNFPNASRGKIFAVATKNDSHGKQTCSSSYSTQL